MNTGHRIAGDDSQPADRNGSHTGDMSENESAGPEAPTAAVPPTPDREQSAPPTQPVTSAQPPGPRLRDTVWNFRSMLAVAFASLVIGGAAGSAITALASDDDGPDRVRIANFDGRGPGMRHGPFDNGPFRRFDRDGGPDLQQGPGQMPRPSTPTPSAPQSGSTG